MSSVIIEIRAGAGGEEAALFANSLFKMYSRYAQHKGWKQKLLDSHPTDLGGLKYVAFELKDGDAASSLKYEGGVHRVQRIPETEKSGRIHTSTATVAVLPKPDDVDVKIRPDELKIDSFRASGPGGQYVNKKETAVRITHLPTGIVVSSQSERNQLQNKENAMTLLSAKILEEKERKKMQSLSSERRSQIGGAGREEKIRTYNFPQDRITDHRIKKSWYRIEKILDGDLDKIVATLHKKIG